MSIAMKISEDDLPMLSAVASQAIALSLNAKATNRHFNDLIRMDPALASRVLHIANSPFYGGWSHARKISDAVLRMGLDQLRNILVIAAAGELFDAKDPIVRALWDHALAVAAASDLIARELDLRDTEDAFIGGLLHDIGKFMIYRQHPGPYAEAIAAAGACGRPLIEIELERFRYFTHESIGGLVIHKWRLPDPVAEAARFHHSIAKTPSPAFECRNLVAIVALANLIVNMNSSEHLGASLTAVLELPYIRHLKLAPERLQRLYLAASDRCQAAELSNTLGA